MCVEKANSSRKLLLISLLHVAMVDRMLSRLVALQAKQKTRVLHRNKKYVVQHVNRHNTCVFSLAFALFVPVVVNACVSSATLCH